MAGAKRASITARTKTKQNKNYLDLLGGVAGPICQACDSNIHIT